MRVEHYLESSARQTPDKVALVCDDQRLTYADIETRAARLAAALRRMGVARHDRVVIHLDNSPATVIAVFAVLKAGAVFVLVNPTTKAAKLAHILTDSGAVAVVADARRHRVVSEALAAAPAVRGVVVVGDASPPFGAAGAEERLDDILALEPPARGGAAGIDIDLASLIYTSGLTGVPKGVMLSHLNMCTAARSITTYLENTSDDVILNVLPLSFDYGLYQVLMAFRVGARVILERAFTYPLAVLATLRTERATGFPIVPTIAALLVQLDLSRQELPDLRYITNTGAALPVAHIQALRRWLPHVRFYSMYGLTECKRVAYLPPGEIDRRPLSVGKPMPNTDVMLVDEGGEPVADGVGELVVRGSNVMQGYWNRPVETARALRPGRLVGERWLFSGDLFRRDQDGFLYFVGRRDDVIKCRGEKVSPREVENVLHDLAGVVEAVVTGQPDEVLGHAVIAYVVARDGTLTEQDVLRHCARHLDDVMVPKEVRFVETLPRTATGKVDRRAVGASVAGGGDAGGERT